MECVRQAALSLPRRTRCLSPLLRDERDPLQSSELSPHQHVRHDAVLVLMRHKVWSRFCRYICSAVLPFFLVFLSLSRFTLLSLFSCLSTFFHNDEKST